MDTLISVYDLLLFVVFSFLLVICVLIVKLLLNLNHLVKQANVFVNKNHTNISETLIALPETIKHVNEMSLSIKAGVDKVGIAVEGFETTLTNTIDSVGQGTGSFLAFISGIGNIIKAFSSLFSKGKD